MKPSVCGCVEHEEHVRFDGARVTCLVPARWGSARLIWLAAAFPLGLTAWKWRVRIESNSNWQLSFGVISGNAVRGGALCRLSGQMYNASDAVHACKELWVFDSMQLARFSAVAPRPADKSSDAIKGMPGLSYCLQADCKTQTLSLTAHRSTGAPLRQAKPFDARAENGALAADLADCYPVILLFGEGTSVTLLEDEP
jgi:hypothetical protein